MLLHEDGVNRAAADASMPTDPLPAYASTKSGALHTRRKHIEQRFPQPVRCGANRCRQSLQSPRPKFTRNDPHPSILGLHCLQKECPMDMKINRRSFFLTGTTAIASTALSYSRIPGANDRISLGHIGIGCRGSGLAWSLPSSRTSTTSR